MDCVTTTYQTLMNNRFSERIRTVRALLLQIYKPFRFSNHTSLQIQRFARSKHMIQFPIQKHTTNLPLVIPHVC